MVELGLLIYLPLSIKEDLRQSVKEEEFNFGDGLDSRGTFTFDFPKIISQGASLIKQPTMLCKHITTAYIQYYKIKSQYVLESSYYEEVSTLCVLF